MKTIFKKYAAAAGMLLAASVITATASAGCSDLGIAKLHKQAWKANNESAAMLTTVADAVDPIVGMWQVKFISEGNAGIPDGTVLDNGFAQWHSDGTEIQNSSRNPETQSFCLGVWKRAGKYRYRLNHFAISWDQSNPTAPLGPGHIQEQVSLGADANSFSGTFIIDQYDGSGNLLAHVTGNIAAKRITPETPISAVM